jgi:hypothetical protein
LRIRKRVASERVFSSTKLSVDGNMISENTTESCGALEKK